MHLAKTIRSGLVGLLGVLGSVVCAGAMVLSVIGSAGAAAAASGRGMAEMGDGAQSGLLEFLIEFGPIILVASVALVTVSLGWRRRIAAVPALAAGALLFWGMYAQPNLLVMYIAIGLGFAVWAATFIGTRSSSSQVAR